QPRTDARPPRRTPRRAGAVLPKMARAVLAAALIACCVAAAPVRSERGPLNVGGVPVQLLPGQGSLWVLTCHRGCTGEGRRAMGRVVRIDPLRARIVASGPLARPDVAAVGNRGVYVTDFWRAEILRID